MARKLLAAFVFLTFGMLFIPSLLSSPVVSAQAGTGTLSFGVPVNVQNDVGNGSYPVVVNQGNNVFITWTESNGVYFRDYNATTELYTPPIGSPPASIPLNSKNPSHFSFPLAAMNGTNVYVLWAQSVKFPKGDQQVFVSVSNKSGAPGTFTTINASTPFKLSKGLATISVEPAITAWGNDVYVTWTGSSSTFVSSSTNDGKNWSAPVELLSIPREQQISAFGSDAYIVGDSGSNGLVLSYTTNNGVTWSTSPIRTKGVTFENSGVSETWVSAYGAYVYVTWETKDTSASACSGRISCNSSIYAAYGTLSAGKVTMHDYAISSIGQELNSTNGSFFDPQIAAYGNYAFLTYHKVGGNTVFVRVVNTTDQIWGPSINVEGPNVNTWGYDIVAGGGSAFTTFGVTHGGTTSAYIAYTQDNGGTSGSDWFTQQVSNNPSGTTAEPISNNEGSGCVTNYGSTTFLAWEQNSGPGTNYQIWFSASSI